MHEMSVEKAIRLFPGAGGTGFCCFDYTPICVCVRERIRAMNLPEVISRDQLERLCCMSHY